MMICTKYWYRARACLIALVSIATMLFACVRQPSEDFFETLPEPVVRTVALPESILLIGNSFTFFNDGIDYHIGQIYRSVSNGASLNIERQTTPNQSLRGHYEDPATKQALGRRDWDIVVFQGASYEATSEDTKAEFTDYAAKLAELIRQKNAEPALFMTWAYWTSPAMIEQIAETYIETGNANRAFVVPAGLAWERYRRERPAAALYSDTRHPSPAGTYLAACVFYASLFNASPIGIPYDGGLPKNKAEFLQKIAWETARRFYQRSE